MQPISATKRKKKDPTQYLLVRNEQSCGSNNKFCLCQKDNRTLLPHTLPNDLQ